MFPSGAIGDLEVLKEAFVEEAIHEFRGRLEVGRGEGRGFLLVLLVLFVLPVLLGGGRVIFGHV